MLAEIIENHWKKLFWFLFTIASLVFIAEVITSTITMDIMIGFVLILLGLNALGEEMRAGRIRKEQEKQKRHINEILQWADKSYDYMRGFKERHENRLFRLDSRLSDTEARIERNTNMLIRKMIDLENSLNTLLKEMRDRKAMIESYMLVKSIREREGLKEEEKAIEIAKKKGRITSREYARTFGVSQKTASERLKALASKGMLKKVGKGRGTYYIAS